MERNGNMLNVRNSVQFSLRTYWHRSIGSVHTLLSVFYSITYTYENITKQDGKRTVTDTLLQNFNCLKYTCGYRAVICKCDQPFSLRPLLPKTTGLRVQWNLLMTFLAPPGRIIKKNHRTEWVCLALTLRTCIQEVHRQIPARTLPILRHLRDFLTPCMTFLGRCLN
jgi:hypothetical protein